MPGAGRLTAASVVRPAPRARRASVRAVWLVPGLATVAAVALGWAALAGDPHRVPALLVGVVAAVLGVVGAAALVRSLQASEGEREARDRQLECVLSLNRLVRSPGVAPEEICQGAVELAPRVLRRPGAAGARLQIGARVWVTEGFEPSRSRLEATVVVGGEAVGTLAVHLAGGVPPRGGDVAAADERAVLEAVADRVGAAVQLDELGHRRRERGAASGNLTRARDAV